MKGKSILTPVLAFFFICFTGTLFAQMTPAKANQRLKNQGFVVINHTSKTTKFIGQVKGVKLVDGALVAAPGFEIIEGNDEDVLINKVSTVTVRYPDGKSVTRSCGCQGGGGSCDVKANASGSYYCEGDDCCHFFHNSDLL